MDNGQKDLVLLKGNEVIAKAAIRYGYDGFFGYPITPQSEVLETLAVDKPWETTGMVVLHLPVRLSVATVAQWQAISHHSSGNCPGFTPDSLLSP